jgi:hypothetical protein
LAINIPRSKMKAPAKARASGIRRTPRREPLRQFEIRCKRPADQHGYPLARIDRPSSTLAWASTIA